MSLVENLEIDIINYKGKKDFQVLVEYNSKNLCSIIVKRRDTLNKKQGWEENIDIFVHDHNGNCKQINVGSSKDSNIKSKTNVELPPPFELIESNKKIEDAWEKGYTNLTLNTHFIPEISRDDFNKRFHTNIVSLPGSIYAVGMANGGVYKYHDSYDGHTWAYEINQTIDYIITAAFTKEARKGNKPRDFYFLICALDGYMEGYYPSARNVAKIVGECEYKGKQWVVLNKDESNVYPELHKQKYILGQSIHPDTAYTIAMPDRYYLELNRYNLYRSIHRGIPFKNKIAKIVYAGNVRGSYYNFTKRRDIRMPQRKYFNSDNVSKDNIHAPSQIDRSEMMNYKYLLDIDGNASTWDATAWKLNSGSVIFKTDSNWSQWFYSDYKAWVHYIPVEDDFNNIQERFKWCEENPERCKEMIKNSKILFQTIYKHENVLKYTEDVIEMLMNLQVNKQTNPYKNPVSNIDNEKDLIKYL